MRYNHYPSKTLAAAAAAAALCRGLNLVYSALPSAL